MMHKLQQVAALTGLSCERGTIPDAPQPFRMCRASKRREDQPDIICAGLAQKSTSKAEDVCAVTITNDASIAAVFDGHGGKMRILCAVTRGQRKRANKKRMDAHFTCTILYTSSSVLDSAWCAPF